MYNVTAVFMAIDKMTGTVNKIAGNMSVLETRAGKIGAAMSTAGSRMTKGLTLPLLALGAGSVKMAADFEQSMRNVNSIAQLPEEQFKSLNQEVIDFSYNTRSSATDVADALYNVVSAGLELDETIKSATYEGQKMSEAMVVMKASSSAAGAGMASVADTSKLVIAAMRAYGKSADEAEAITDIFLHTVNQGLTTLPELAQSLGRIMPLAANLGVSIEELGFSMAQMTQTGLDTAEATTALNAVFISLLKPSEALQSAIERLGYASGTELVEATGGLTGALRALRDGGFLETNEALIELFPNIRAIRGGLALTAVESTLAAGAVEEFGKAAEGARERMKEQQYKSLNTQLKKLKGALSVLAISFGTELLPPLTEAAEWAVKLFKGFGNLDEGTRKTIIQIGLLVAGLGPLLKIGGMLVTTLATTGSAMVRFGSSIASAAMAAPAFIGDMGAAFSLLRGGASAMSVATSGAAGLATTLGLVAVAAVAVGAAYMKFRDFQDTIKEGQEQVNKSLDTWTSKTMEMMDAGQSASDIMEVYAEKINEASDAHDRGGIIADLFVSKQGTIGESVRAAAEQAAFASSYYGEYAHAIEQLNSQLPAGAEGVMTLAQYQAEAAQIVEFYGEGTYLAAEAMAELDKKTRMMTQAEFEAANGIDEAAIAMSNIVGQALEAAGSLEASKSSALGASDAFADLAGNLVNLPGALGAAIGGIGGAIGAMEAAAAEAASFDQALLNLHNRVSSANAATADYGKTTQWTAVDQMRLVNQTGVLNAMMDDTVNAEQNAASAMDAYRDATDAAGQSARGFGGAVRDTNAALQTHQKSLLSQAESLKDAGPQDVARAGMAALDKQLQAGMISFEDYTRMVMQTQDAFELVTPQSRALTAGIDALANAVAKGIVPAESYDEMLQQLPEAAEGGLEGVEALFAQFGIAPGTIDPATGAVDAFGNSAYDARNPVTGLKTDADLLFISMQDLTSAPWVIDIQVPDIPAVPGIQQGSGSGGGGTGGQELQSGMWNVPYTGFQASLHKGEMVVPPLLAEFVRAMSGGRGENRGDRRSGGDTYILNYTGNRFDNDGDDAASQMRRIQMESRLRRG